MEICHLFDQWSYIAISKKTDIKMVQEWQKAYKSLVEDGMYAKIMAGYFPK